MASADAFRLLGGCPSPTGSPNLNGMDHAPTRAPSALYGRDEAISRALAAAGTPHGAPLVLVSGPIGVGRSSVLAAVRDRLAAASVPTLVFRVARNERTRPYAVATRLAAELGSFPRGDGGEPRRPAPTPDNQASTATKIAATLTTAVFGHRQLVVLLDDLQWIDAGSLAVLVPLVRTLAGTAISFVGSSRTPRADSGDEQAALATLREAGLVELVPLRPLRDSEVTALITDLLQAKPAEAMAAAIRQHCRGIPAAVLAAIAGYQRTGALRVIDRHAYLAWPSRPPELPPDLPLVEHFRQLGEPVWPVAKALAVLYPLGDVAIRLAAEAVEISEEEVLAVLGSLHAEGFLLPGPKPGHWRFRLPLLTAALTACLGPYERRRLSTLAVAAIWAGTAQSDDSRYLPEQLVTAGRLVDPGRAANELLGAGTGIMLDDGYFAERWLRTAIELLTDPTQRAWALFLHAAACCIHLRYQEAVDSAWTVLSGYADLLTDDAVLELEMIYVVSLGGKSDFEALANITDESWRSLPGGPGHQIVTRGAALGFLDRWLEADEHFESTRDVWRNDSPAVSAFGQIFAPGIAAFLGRMDEFNRNVEDPTKRPLWDVERHRFEQLIELSRNLMAYGELDRSDRLLTEYELPSQQRPVPDKVVTAALHGDWDEAINLARLSLAMGSSLGYMPAHTVMCREMGVILTARGRLAQAREIMERVRTDQPVLLHLLAGPQSDLTRIMGDKQEAHRIVAEALAGAKQRGLIIGTDELWLRAARWELATRNQPGAEHCLAEATRVAELQGTGRAKLCQLVIAALVHEDPAAAAEAIELARNRDQPHELAVMLTLLAGRGLADSKLLLEAYERYGRLDALLPRARLRQIMRDKDIPVPGRSATVAENERLLAALVTEGLTNRELSIVLGASEKSVEGRMTRLFQRTGYRSRVELATAMLTGEYPS